MAARGTGASSASGGSVGRWFGIGAGALGVALALGLSGWPWAHEGPAGPAAAQAAAAPSPLASLLGQGPLQPPAAPATAGGRDAGELQQALYGRGSLRQTAPDGGWSLDAAGRLKPDIALRRRFDHLLTALGEATPAELGVLLQAQARGSLPAPAADEVMQLWQRYLQLQQHRFGHNADLRDVASWQPALDERARVRRELLGPAWAEAFYGEEEAQLREHIAARDGRGGPATPTTVADASAAGHMTVPEAARAPVAGEDPQVVFQRRQAALGVEAAQRLQQLDEEEAQWAQRVSQAREQVQRLKQAPELSEPQRQEAIARYVEAQFPADEQLRARAVLGLSGVQ